MKWLLLLPLLLLVACAPAGVTSKDIHDLQEQVAWLHGQVLDLQDNLEGERQVARVRFDHLEARIHALECAADPAKLGRIGLACP